MGLEEESIVLEVELRFFESKKEEWLEKHRGRYVLIKGEELMGVFTSLEDAYNEGVKQYGNQPFFIKQVTEVENIEQVPSLMLGIIHARL